jgi:CBS domain containing-hemolysin-like protein
MTPRHDIIGISKTDFLGPLMLNDLHKVGHSWLPVMDGDLDHIIGILNIKGLMTLDKKKSVTVDKAMQSKVYYVRDDQTLHHALVALLHTHHHLLIVINEARETVGILTLEDIIEALLGRQIVDEFNEHDNIRAVAAQKSH